MVVFRYVNTAVYYYHWRGCFLGLGKNPYYTEYGKNRIKAIEISVLVISQCPISMIYIFGSSDPKDRFIVVLL